MEREVGEGREGRGRRRGGGMRKGIIVGGMIIGLLMGCNNGLAELEKENGFYKSVVKIGQGFQEIFGIFGSAMGDALGFNAIKPEDNRSKVGDHFKNLGDGLKNTKEKLEGLAKEINSIPNADTKGVEGVISSASGVIEKLIASVKKLSEVTSKGGTNIGDAVTTATKAVGATEGDVKIVVEGVQSIIETAKNSGVTINNGDPGTAVAAGGTKAGEALVGKNSAQAGDGAAAKLAAEVAQADPWAMIDKIKDSKNTAAKLADNNANEAAALATQVITSGGEDATHNGAKTNADLAAAVALKAMTQSGKFSSHNDELNKNAVKAAAANAVNKVLGVLDEIIRRTVAKNLEKVREAVKGINYSDTPGATEATQAKK